MLNRRLGFSSSFFSSLSLSLVKTFLTSRSSVRRLCSAINRIDFRCSVLLKLFLTMSPRAGCSGGGMCRYVSSALGEGEEWEVCRGGGWRGTSTLPGESELGVVGVTSPGSTIGLSKSRSGKAPSRSANRSAGSGRSCHIASGPVYLNGPRRVPFTESVLTERFGRDRVCRIVLAGLSELEAEDGRNSVASSSSSS